MGVKICTPILDLREYFRKNAPKKDNPKKLFFQKYSNSPDKTVFLGISFFRCTFSENNSSDLKLELKSEFFTVHPYWPIPRKKYSFLEEIFLHLFVMKNVEIRNMYKGWK